MNFEHWNLRDDEKLTNRLKKTATNSLYGLRAERSWLDETVDEMLNRYNPVTQMVETMRKNLVEEENKMIIENAKAIINGKTYKVRDIRIKHEYGADPIAELTVDMHPFNQIPAAVVIHNTGVPTPPPKSKVKPIIPDIKHVIFNYPATIVFWDDGTKTVVKCKEGDQWDPHAGISAAISKKFFGNQVSKWVKKAEYANEPPVEENAPTIVDAIKDVFLGGH